MNKLTRLALWGSLFVVTISVAIGLSLLALRVRAAVDAGRQKNDVIPLVEELQSGVTPTACPFAQSECALPGNADPTGQNTAPPTVDVPGQTYRDCCGNIRTVPTPAPSFQTNQGSAAEPTPTPSCH